MKAIDFKMARVMHKNWLFKFKQFVAGRTTLTDAEAFSPEDCELGRWLYSKALLEHNTESEMKILENVHRRLHTTAMRVRDLKKSGDTINFQRETERLYLFSTQVMAQLEKMENKLK